MPSAITEVGSGKQFSRSSNDGQLADSETRVFRIVLQSPSEVLDIQSACGVRIGDQHPVNPDLYCVSFDARFDGDSRMLVSATFNYQTSPSATPQDPKSQPPPARPANWSTSATLAEVPKSTWRQRITVDSWSDEVAAVNPVQDMYDGVTALEPVVAIKIDQWESTDPTRHLAYAGSVNLEAIGLGSLSMAPGTVMFRGVTSAPAVESWGGLNYRGWKCTYDFAYRRNITKIRIGGVGPSASNVAEIDIGWDIAVPMSGLNVRAVEPANAAADEDAFAQPLAHFNGKVQKGSFDAEGTFTPDENEDFKLPFNVDEKDRVAAMVKVMEYSEGGMSLARASAPIALKPNGRALKTHDEDGNLINEPYVYAYRVQPAINFTTTLGLRLF